MNWIKQLIDYYRSPDKDYRIKNLEATLSAAFRVRSLAQVEAFKTAAAIMLGRIYLEKYDQRITIRLRDIDNVIILSTVAKNLETALAGVEFVAWWNKPEPVIAYITYHYRGDLMMTEKVHLTLTKGMVVTSSIYNIV